MAVGSGEELPTSTYEGRARRGVWVRSGRGARFRELQRSRVQGTEGNDLLEMYDSESSKAEEELAEEERKNGEMRQWQSY